MKKFLPAVLAAFTLSGCASILSGTTQEIVVNTNPDQASCKLLRQGQPIGQVASTPGAVTIKKTKYDITIECEKAGYQKATYFNKSGIQGSTFGNIILGGGIGWAIDSAAGADNHYTSPVNITLVPAGQPAPVSSDPADKKKDTDQDKQARK